MFRTESKKIPIDGPWDLEPLSPRSVYDFDYPEEESDEDPLDNLITSSDHSYLGQNNYEITIEIKEESDFPKETVVTDQTLLLQEYKNEAKSDETRSIVIPIKERSYCIFIPYALLIGGLSISMIINAVNEIDDGIQKSPNNLSIIPISYPELAFIPNDLTMSWIIRTGVAISSLAFDCPMMVSGLRDTHAILIKGELPEAWTTANLSNQKLRRTLKICVLVSTLSLVNQIISGISIVNDDEKAKNDLFPIYISKAAVFIGNAAFIFSEAHKLPDAIIKLFGKMRRKYHPAHEVVSLLMRIPGSICAMLFAYSAANGVFIFSNLPEKILCLVLLNTSAFATDFTYSGEYCAEVFDDFLCAVERIFRGIFPSPSQILGTLSASAIGGLLAYLQRNLTEDYLYQMDVSEEVKNYFLYPVILAYTAELMVTYSGAIYNPAYRILSNIGKGISSCCHTLVNKIRKCCGERPQPEEQKPIAKKFYGNGMTLFEKNGMKQPLLAKNEKQQNNKEIATTKDKVSRYG